MTIIELFSGIGSQAKALQNIGIDIDVAGTCEWDIHAFVAYDAIHNSPDIPDEITKMQKPELLDILRKYTLSNDGKTAMDYTILKTYSVESLRRIFAAIQRSNNFVDINALTGKQIPRKVDILTYSFPCQDLSNVGAFHGYNKGIDKDSGSRSSLLWQVGRILREMCDSRRKLPRFLLMENVPTLLSERHKKNFDIWRSDLEQLGYYSYYYQLNAKDFGLPQNRPRLLMISVYVGRNRSLKKRVAAYFNEKSQSENVIKDYARSEYYHKKCINELFRMDYSRADLLDEAINCTPNDTPSRRRIWDENPQLVLEDNIVNPAFDMIRTVTTKQDRNPNSGNLFFDSGIDGRSKFRYLTPRECMLFMGFTDEDYENIVRNNPEIHKGSIFFPRDKIIRMAGNSIPVKLLEGVFLQIKQIDEQVLNSNGRTFKKDPKLQYVTNQRQKYKA